MDLKETEFKKAAVFLNYALASPPFELHSSVIEELKSSGSEVTVYTCNASLAACTPNPSGSKLVCTYCKQQQKELTSQFDRITVKTLPNFKKKTKKSPVFKKAKIAAMSSMASITRCNSETQLTKKWRRYLINLETSSAALYGYFSREILLNNYDLLIVFNGRFAEARPLIEAAKDKDVSYGIVEVKKSEHELLFINELIHSINANTKRALRFYLEDKERAKNLATEFFAKKVSNISTGDPVYTVDQAKGALPGYLRADGKYIVIYTSSDDEYKYIGAEWDGFVPEAQSKEIAALAYDLRDTSYTIIVKMHPNQAYAADDQISEYLQLESANTNLYLERPDSKVDSYALMDIASIIVTFASTIGVEASYWRKVVINIGDSTYSRMRVGYRVKSGLAAACLIRHRKLNPKSRRGSIIWGAYLSGYRSGLLGFSRDTDGVYRYNRKEKKNHLFLYWLQLLAKFFINLSKPGPRRLGRLLKK